MNERTRPINLDSMRGENLIGNGAGPVKLTEHVLELALSDADCIVIGSLTINQRLGNPGTTYYDGTSFSLNSKGLPNPGLEYYKRYLPEMSQIAHDHGKVLIASVAGFSPEEYAILAEVIMSSGVDGQELNFGCPNVWGADGAQKRITSFDEDLTGQTLLEVEKAIGAGGWTAVKLSPYSDPAQLEAIAYILSQSKVVNAVTSTNTFPNAFSFNEDGGLAIDQAGGLASMSGDAMKPIGLGQVKQLRVALPAAIAIIGVGGISSGADARDYFKVGADAVQITTAYINFGPSIFTKIKDEFNAVGG